MVAALSEGRPEVRRARGAARLGGRDRARPRRSLPGARRRRRGGLRPLRGGDEAAARDGRRARGPVGRAAAAARHAAEVPLRCVEACVDLVAAAEALAGRSNVNAVERPQRGLAARRGGRSRRGRQCPGQPALRRRPGVRGRDDRAGRRAAPRRRAPRRRDARGRRRRRAARGPPGARRAPDRWIDPGARLLEGAPDRRRDPDRGRRGCRDASRRRSGRPPGLARRHRRAGRALDRLPRADPARLREGRDRRRVRRARGRGDRGVA